MQFTDVCIIKLVKGCVIKFIKCSVESLKCKFPQQQQKMSHQQSQQTGTPQQLAVQCPWVRMFMIHFVRKALGKTSLIPWHFKDLIKIKSKKKLDKKEVESLQNLPPSLFLWPVDGYWPVSHTLRLRNAQLTFWTTEEPSPLSRQTLCYKVLCLVPS